MDNIWILVSSSAVIAAIVSSIASYLINKYSQNQAYKNDYYKSVISRRFETYQNIDDIIRALKSTMVDNDGRGCHSMFTGGKKEYYQTIVYLHNALTDSIWLSNEMFNELRNLNQLFLNIGDDITDDASSNIAIGKENYSKLGKYRTDIENQFKTDLLKMYDVEGFLETKVILKKLIYEIPNKTSKQ